MEFDFLTPVDEDLVHYIDTLSSQHLGKKIVFHTEAEFPEIEKIKIAIIGIPEYRGEKNSINTIDLNHIRRELYNLFPGNWQASIADLGDILPGNSLEDTYYASKSVISYLLKKNIIPIIIGGSQDITYPMYRAYDKLEQMVNLVTIDSKFDLGIPEDTISSNSYLGKIIMDEPNNLFNYCNIGYQTYYNSQEEIDLIEKLYFDAYRLGEISNNITLAEPVLRDADIVSVDLTSVKSSDSGNISKFTPNGFNGKEICALARYAGISDKVSCFGVFNYGTNISEKVLIAQIIWYFIEGINFRSNEYPFTSKINYSKYIVPIEDESIIFYKSNKTDRWWMEVPIFSNTHNKINKNTLLPCSHEEYLTACNQELPERWWKAQKKNLV